MKTVLDALIDSVMYPIPVGLVENICVKRDIIADTTFTKEVMDSTAFKGALADCLVSLLQAVNFSEADKSIGSLTDAQRKALLNQANKLYDAIGEEEVDLLPHPMVFIEN